MKAILVLIGIGVLTITFMALLMSVVHKIEESKDPDMRKMKSGEIDNFNN